MRCARELIATTFATLATFAILAGCTDFDGLQATALDDASADAKASTTHVDAASGGTDPVDARADVVTDACAGAHMRAFAGHCYLFVAANRKWAEAENDCVAWGGHLVTITSVEEHSFVLGMLDAELPAADPGRGAWIGLNDIAVEGTFTWISGEPVGFTNWASTADGGVADTDCVYEYASQFNGHWDDFQCSISTKSVCER
jgi:hypothetical protein